MGRQVGAAITTRSGEIIAVGTNEVPRAGGGQYWDPADPDGRDFAQYPSVDSSDDWKRRVVREMLNTLGDKGWIVPDRQLSADSRDDEDLVTQIVRDLRRTRLHGLVEFGRALHAEMSALLDAARRGASVQDATLYCTTFPCHNCTRGVIAAGIGELYFVHPYAKSLAEQLHSDSVTIDPERGSGPSRKVLFCQFLGVAPRGYPLYFQFSRTQRKHDGKATALSRAGIPRVLWENDVWAHGGPPVPAEAITIRERDTVSAFNDAVRAADLPSHTPMNGPPTE
jgi:cytidine deaminase